MLKILRKRGKIAPQEQFLPLSTIFYYLMLDFCVETGIKFSLRDKRLFEITEAEITRVDCASKTMIAKSNSLTYISVKIATQYLKINSFIYGCNNACVFENNLCDI